jgi:hypothetical protein
MRRAGTVALLALILALSGSVAVPAGAETRIAITEITLPNWPSQGLAAGPNGTMWYTALNYVVGSVNPNLTVQEFAIAGGERTSPSDPTATCGSWR